MAIPPFHSLFPSPQKYRCYLMMACGQHKRGKKGRQIRTVGQSATKTTSVSRKGKASGRVAKSDVRY
jgi:hypothetical protein